MLIKINESIRSVLRPPEELTVSQWADRYRVLDARYSAEPGLWRTDRAPYLRGIMDAFTDPSVSRITLVKSARVGGTETMDNMVLFAIDQDPGPVLWVTPREDDASDASNRKQSMIEGCPQARRHIEGKSWASAKQISTGNMNIYFGYAASPQTLISKTCRRVFFDELDNCESSAGALGNHLALAAERVTTFGHRGKVVGNTTPTVPEAAGWQEWLNSDRRRYRVPCPFCGHFQILFFDGVKWPDKMSDPDKLEINNLAWYECESCNKKITESFKRWMLLRGIWLPESQSITNKYPVPDWSNPEAATRDELAMFKPDIAGDKPITRRIGFHINSLYSPWRSFSLIAAAFLRMKDDPNKLRVFRNSWLGEPWEQIIQTTKLITVGERILPTQSQFVAPKRAIKLLAGADVQATEIYYVIRAFGPHPESWLINHGKCTTFAELYHICFETPYQIDGGTAEDVLRCEGVAIDSAHRTREVYEFAARPGVIPVRGFQGGDAGDISLRPSKPLGKTDPLTVWRINTTFFKDNLQSLIYEQINGQHVWHLHAATDEEYLKQITSEHKVWEMARGSRREKQVWRQKSERRPNHYLDSEVYCLALAQLANTWQLTESDLRKVEAVAMPEHRPAWVKGNGWWAKASNGY